MKIIATQNNVRIDTYISNETNYTRSKIAKIIKEGQVFINQKPVSASYKVKENDIIEFNPIEEEREKLQVRIDKNEQMELKPLWFGLFLIL